MERTRKEAGRQSAKESEERAAARGVGNGAEHCNNLLAQTEGGLGRGWSKTSRAVENPGKRHGLNFRPFIDSFFRPVVQSFPSEPQVRQGGAQDESARE